MNNYEYCADFAVTFARGSRITVLDYGCGAGEIVNLLRAADVDSFGCDVFYEGGDYSKSVSDEIWGSVIRQIEDGRIPFPDDSFDLIVTNQVMEHVENLDFVLSEINRVLKTGGRVLSLFPDKSVWREGHCGVPCIHWFQKQSRLRIYYGMFFRMFGLGYHTKDKGFFQWSKDFCDWLDKWTHYRPYSEICEVYNKYFGDIRHIEDQWLDKRYAKKHPWIRYMPIRLKQILARKLGHLVFVCTKK